ncbi:MAG: hypothetical protein IJX95_07495 [Lachnospiraceae bacterium]|nr:hypothetical protein [Lachnospiraceae bacterium]
MKLYCLLTCMTLLFTANTTPVVSAVTPIRMQREESASTFAIKTEWVYRFHNGVYQKRLWSSTQNKWLTDWMNV